MSSLMTLLCLQLRLRLLVLLSRLLPQARQHMMQACAALGQLQMRRRQLQDAQAVRGAERQAAAMHAHLLPALTRWQHAQTTICAALATLSAALQSAEGHVLTTQVLPLVSAVRYLLWT
jgi:hypothetical protein